MAIPVGGSLVAGQNIVCNYGAVTKCCASLDKRTVSIVVCVALTVDGNVWGE